VTAPARPPDAAGPQTPLSEAVEQAAQAASQWLDEVAHFAEDEVGRLSAGNYHLDDLATAQVRLLRIWIRNSIRTAGVLSDNLALLSYGTSGPPPPPRMFKVRIGVPAAVELKLRASDLSGQILGVRIASSKIRLTPDVAASGAEPRDITIEVEVDCARVPSDTYVGVLSSEDGTVTVPIRVAIDELGGPVP